MTVRLLSPYAGSPALSVVSLAAATETALIAQNAATAVLPLPSSAVNPSAPPNPDNLFCLIGDSFASQAIGDHYYTSRGLASHLIAISRGRLHLPLSFGFGVSGEKASEVAVRLPAILSTLRAAPVMPRWAIFQMFNNDVLEAAEVTESTAALHACVQWAIGAGMVPVVLPQAPLPVLTRAQLDAARVINAMLDDARKTYPQMIVPGANEYLASGAVDFKAAAATDWNASDSTHPISRAGHKAAVAVWEAIGHHVPAMTDFLTALTPIWATADAATGAGSLTGNPTMTGTSGTVSTGTSGASGLADLWRSERVAGSTVTAVVSKNADGSQRIVFTSDGTGSGVEGFYIRTATAATSNGYTPGEKVFAFADVLIAKPTQAGLLSFVEPQFRCNQTTKTIGAITGANGWLWPDAQDHRLLLRSPVWTIPPATVEANQTINFRMRFELDATVSGEATVDIFSLGVARTSLF